MRTFAQKPGASQQSKPADVTNARSPRSGQALQSVIQSHTARNGHDFSRIPAYQEDRERAPDDGRRGGEPLAAAARRRLESRLGTRIPDVRIHRGPAADRAAAAIGAPAFTVGQDIVLGGAATGERLLAHEAAHTVQQSNATQTLPPAFLPRTAPGSVEERQAEAAARGLHTPTAGAPLAIAAAPTPAAPVLPPVRKFKELWPKFDAAQVVLQRDKTLALARELADAPYDIADLVEHGAELVNWLQQNGEPALAAQVLSHVSSAWMIQFVSLNATLPARGLGGGAPATLVALGKASARAGQHKEAFRFFGVANEILSYYAIEMSTARMKVLEGESAEARDAGNDPARQATQKSQAFPRYIARSNQYSDLRRIYDEMREIYGFYFVLEREALDAGDTKGAADARSRAAALHKEIKEKHTWGGVQTTGGISQEIFNPVEIAEVSYADTPKGPGITLHGANSAETDLTQLPGLPSPKEVGNNVQVQNLGALQGALMEQTDFQAEIGRQPEIRKAFGNEPIDLNDTTKRQRVWQIMYGVFQQSGAGALGSLMALIGRYLKAFTIHTMYNVRDWGKSYLDSEMPTDLAGRAERDCGVYALTVAWDVYQTVKRGDPKLEVTFDLTTMLEHVTLVITDKSTGEFYVVNNDQVSPPQRGDPLAQVAPQYGAVRGLPYTVGPAVTVSLGSTKDPQKKFHDDAWTRYLASVDWGLKLDIPPDVAALEKSDPAAFSEKLREIQQKRYETFYREQEVFDREAKALDPLVTALGPVAGDAKKLEKALTPLVDQAGTLAVRFIRLGPSAGVVAGSKKSQAILPQQAQYLFTQEQGHSHHPIVRVALGILHLQALGGTLTPKQDALLKFCDNVPTFKQQMDAYRAAGAMGPF